jgi:hypothetical protein
MTRSLSTLLVAAAVLSSGLSLSAAEITGEYLEARTCDVYTGPCFANGEIGLTGREAVMAWKVDSGKWANVDLSGLCVALVIRADDTLGYGGTFTSNPKQIDSVILVDSTATDAQKDALVRFVQDTATGLTKSVRRIERAPISLENDFVSGKGKFRAGQLAKIETRGFKGGDCVCSNESVIYSPLAPIENVKAAYTVNMTFDGKGLGGTWTTINKRSAFLGTFSR